MSTSAIAIVKAKRLVSHWNDSDWLLVVLALCGLVALSFNMVSWANSIAFSGVTSSQLGLFLSLGLLAGYLTTRLRLAHQQPESWLTQDAQPVFNVAVGLTILVIGVPVAVFYGAEASRLTGSNEWAIGSAIAALLLIKAFILTGSLLAQFKKLWGLLVMLMIVWLISWFGASMALIETALAAGTSSAWPVLLLGLGALGTVVSLTQLVKKHLDPARPTRYLTFLTHQGPWPSFTGTGALFIASLLALGRNRFFLALVTLAALLEVFVLTTLTDFGNWQLFLGVVIPVTIIAVGALRLLDLYQDSFEIHHRHLPAAPGVVNLAAFGAGLSLIVMIGWVIDVGLLTLPDTIRSLP